MLLWWVWSGIHLVKFCFKIFFVKKSHAHTLLLSSSMFLECSSHPFTLMLYLLFPLMLTSVCPCRSTVELGLLTHRVIIERIISISVIFSFVVFGIFWIPPGFLLSWPNPLLLFFPVIQGNVYFSLYEWDSSSIFNVLCNWSSI